MQTKELFGNNNPIYDVFINKFDVDANEIDILLVAAGHFETENLAIEPLMNKIKDKFNITCELAKQKSPIITI